MYQGYMHHDNKKIQDKIINNFRSNSSNNTNTHLPYASMGTQPRMPSYWSQQAKNVPAFDPHISEVNDIENAIDLTGCHDHTNVVRMIPQFMSLLNNITGTVDHTSDDSSRNKKKVS